MIKRITFGEPPPAPVTPWRVAVCEPLEGGGVITLEWFADGTPLPAGDVVAEEAVVRGGEWLERRWRDGGEKYKHMAIAVRAAGLTREEFSRRWRSHAGTAGGSVIPDRARGRAYVQNHVLRGDCDAINEVYFDDLADLRARAEWFAGIRADTDLFAESRLICVREFVQKATFSHSIRRQ